MESSAPKPSRVRQYIALVKRHPRWSLVIGGAILIAITGGATVYVLTRPMPELPPIPVATPVPTITYYSPLTGIEVEDEAATKRAVTAVMIENSPDARPQSGLKEAGIIYEAVVEGGITRFMALYQEARPETIGPVRSLRPYYIDWLMPFNASIAHVGGSPEALAEIRNGNHRDIDQFFNPNTYWRSTDRYAPHNVYTNTQRLDALNKQKGYHTSEFEGFSRQDDTPAETPTASTITINLSSALYNTSYTYDTTTNSYKRSLAGTPHRDREKGHISPNVIVALKVHQANGYYRNITTSGSGEVVIFQNGTATKGTWHKETRAAQLTFTDTAGEPIKLNRGQTWVTAVPNGQGGVSWK